ncbi:4-hydroxybenzoate transporter [Caballeronia novacaledonica]|uniref:4-hydroxybenzoate transporter n=1 Tax=Caballeronia novacaledonica TaxID=1544861 RepID=A0A2U3ID88_9BURK|nr:MFS transporter [Caballeronia novacaledonica]SPB18184.1 4-hydroxybenzoate transporter [Caballeronia novacaledonica]
MNHPQQAVDVKSFIDGRSLSAKQVLIVVLCFFIVAADGIDVAMMGFIAPSIVHDWQLAKSTFGVVMSAAPLGLVLGALIAGPSSDRLGRKAVLVVSVLLFGIGSIVTALSQDVTQMMVLRFLTGIGLGAAMPNTTILVAEYVPQRRRSLLITTMFIGFGVGSALVGFAAGWLVPRYGWRSVVIFGGIVPLALVPFLIVALPESVRFMLVRNRPMEQIVATLQRVCHCTFAPGTRLFAPEPAVSHARPAAILFEQGYRVTTVSLWVTYFMGLLVIYLITGWLPMLIKDAGMSIEQAANITAMFQTGGIAGAILAGWAMDRLRPVPVIAAAYIGGALCVYAVGSAGAQSTSLSLWMFAAGFFMNGAQTGLNAFAPVCYPTVARATGVSWMLAFGRFGSIVGSASGGLLIGLGYNFGALVGMLAVPAVLAGLAITASLLSRNSARDQVDTTSTAEQT